MSPSDAYYVTLNDFSFETFLPGAVPLVSAEDWTNRFHAVTLSGYAVTTVIATHKPTGRKSVFSIVVGNGAPCFTMTHYIDYGFITRHNGSSSGDVIDNAQAYVAEKLNLFFGLNVSYSVDIIYSIADFCRDNEQGNGRKGSGITKNSIREKCWFENTIVDHLKRDKLQDDIGNGTETNTRYIWTGHILTYDDECGPPSVSYPDQYAVVMTPLNYVDNTGANDPDISVQSETCHSLLHETSHQLGASDHYCKQDYNEYNKCSNFNCDMCARGKNKIRTCIMGSGFDDILTVDNASLYCEECLGLIDVHVTDHH